jgi:hypothetical protein
MRDGVATANARKRGRPFMQRIRNYALARYTYHRELPEELRSPIKIGTYLMILWAIRSTTRTILLLTTVGAIGWAGYKELQDHWPRVPW